MGGGTFAALGLALTFPTKRPSSSRAGPLHHMGPVPEIIGIEKCLFVGWTMALKIFAWLDHSVGCLLVFV